MDEAILCQLVGIKQSWEGGGKEPSVMQVMKYKLEKMKDVEGC